VKQTRTIKISGTFTAIVTEDVDDPIRPGLIPTPPAGYRYQFTRPGWASFGLPLPPGFATAAVRVGELETQTDVRTTWADGSIRFAQVTAKVPAGELVVAPGPDRRGARARGLSGGLPSATVVVTVDGQDAVATMPAMIAPTWLDGPLVREGRAIVPFAGATGRAAHLRAIFDCRVYADGAAAVSVTMQNGRNHPDAGTLTYDVRITVDGVTFTQNTVTHSYMARYSKTRATGDRAEWIPDFQSFYDAGALRPYRSTIADAPSIVDADRFGILEIGDLKHPLNAPGDRPDIGLLPAWAAQYVVHPSREAWDYLLANGRNVAGAFSLHLDNLEDGMLHLSSECPNFNLLAIDSDGVSGPAGAGPMLYAPEQGGSHTPALAALPYLLTGDRSLLDELKYWANAGILSSPSNRGAAGIITNNQVRDIAWTLRDVGNAIAWAPDADPDRAYFAEMLENNRRDLDAKAGGDPDTTLLGPSYGQPVAYAQTLFMHAYCVWAFDHLARLGFTPPAYFEKTMRYWVRLWASHPAFDRAYLISYQQFVTRPDGVPFADEAACFHFNYAEAPGTNHPWNRFTCPPPTDATSYLPELYDIFAIATLRGLPNADAALEWILGYQNAAIVPLLDTARRQYAIAVD